MREIALDTETTGISHHEGHRIIEIGAVELFNQFRTGRELHVYINPERDIDEGAFKVHGLSREFLHDKPVFRHVAAELMAFIGDARLVIHNAAFDIGFINHHLSEVSFTTIPYTDERVFDTLLFARKKYPGAKNSLDALCTRFNISLETREKHGAIIDARLLADVYAELIGAGSTQKNLLFMGTNQAISNNDNQSSATIKYGNRAIRQPRIFAANDDELAAHESFIGKIKEALWKQAAS